MPTTRAKPTALDIPYKFTQREYQKPFWLQIQDDPPVNRAVLVWHRRSGKDKTMLNAIVPQMLRRVGAYYYVFPEFNQGRKALWDNIDNEGFKTMDHIPEPLRKRTDNGQMLIELFNGSIFQVIGASDINRIVGTNPIGIVFSEYSLMAPNIIGFLLPIVVANKGFMWFNFTPRGDNHARNLYENAKKDKWFVSYMPADKSGVFSPGELEEIRQDYIKLYGDDKLFNQEFMCSFDEPVQGSYYGALMTRAQDEGRIANVPWRNDTQVSTYWDIGVNDATAIWFVQFVGDEVRLIDYYESNEKALDHYVKVVKEKPYIYDQHWGPHDLKVREFVGGSRIEAARKLGVNFRIAPRLPREDGINAARLILSRCYFDKTKCEQGIAALKFYHKKYNEETKTYGKNPEHDWSSNGADAFRYLAVVQKKNTNLSQVPIHDIPGYASLGVGPDSGGYLRDPRFPFGGNVPMDLTTDAIDKDGFVR